jgi:hypothetical protein
MAIMGCAACNFFPISKISNYAGAPPLGTGVGLYYAATGAAIAGV